MKLLRPFLVSVILTISILVFPHVVTPTTYAQKQEMTYVGSSKSNKYHRPSCVWAKRIKPSNLVGFSSKEEAMQAGYIPCKVCKP
ncbi:MAG: Ada metal-binding domain-containing protein [Candidatus Omnitrophota bacterium]